MPGTAPSLCHGESGIITLNLCPWHSQSSLFMMASGAPQHDIKRCCSPYQIPTLTCCILAGVVQLWQAHNDYDAMACDLYQERTRNNVLQASLHQRNELVRATSLQLFPDCALLSG